ncbi:DNA polymerase III [Candidatus Pelagibacter sp.]|nr:DNA polymerase III [Candidatus Pelagibacter sp.]
MSPLEQINLYGLGNYFNELKILYDNKNLPNKILLSGSKGVGKFTLSLHFINYILSKNEDYPYDFENFKINENNRSFKLVNNNTSSNLYLVDIKKDKKNIEINQIRELIDFCNKSSFNNKPRFVLINNLELMNLNSSNALLRTLEEPNDNIYFILINNSQKILPTIKSRCLNFKIVLTQKEIKDIFSKITNQNIDDFFNENIITHYFTTGDFIKFYNFSIENDIDLSNISLKDLLLKIIDENHYKKETLDINLIYTLIQMYFLTNIKITKNYEFYTKFLHAIANIKKFNLDIESLFIQFRHQLKND